MIIYLFFFRGEVRIFKKKPFGTCLRGVSGSCRLQGLTKLSFPYFLDTWYYRVFHQVTKISHFLAGIQMSFMASFFGRTNFRKAPILSHPSSLSSMSATTLSLLKSIPRSCQSLFLCSTHLGH